jgi:tetratricopeptide (TPR) repeat protein
MSKFVLYLFLAMSAGAADYHDPTTFVGPCAQDLAAVAKTGDLERARREAEIRVRSGAAGQCADACLVAAWCAMKLESSDAIAAGEQAVQRLPQSAAAHLCLATAYAQRAGAAGVIEALRAMRPARRELEETIRLDPDCHPARVALVNIFGLPALLGGDADKCAEQLKELAARDPYSAALVQGTQAARRKNFPGALEYFRQARQLAPDQPEPIRGLIKAYAGLGDFPAAFRECDRLTPPVATREVAAAALLDLSVDSGLREPDAIAAGERFLADARNVSAVTRARVEVDLAILLKAAGRAGEADRLVAAAEARWRGAEDLFRQREKVHRRQLEKAKGQ